MYTMNPFCLSLLRRANRSTMRFIRGYSDWGMRVARGKLQAHIRTQENDWNREICRIRGRDWILRVFRVFGGSLLLV